MGGNQRFPPYPLEKEGRNPPALGIMKKQGPRRAIQVRAGLALYKIPMAEDIRPCVPGVPGLRSSQGRGAALDRQRGRRSRAGASLLRP